MNNESNVSSIPSCQKFDPYWIYAISIPFLGVVFNGLLLAISFTFISHSFRSRTRSASCSTSKTYVSNRLSDTPLDEVLDHWPNRPEFASNCFVINCAMASLAASLLRTITTTYLFSSHYFLCPNLDYRNPKIVDVLIYVQFSLFNIAYINFMITMNMEKLIFVLKPLHYPTVMTNTRVCVICVITWFVSLAWFPLYFAQSEEDVIRSATILVSALMVCPSLFCLISSTVLAVVVFRHQFQDRRVRGSAGYRSLCGYVLLSLRLFQGVLCTFLTSLPHPLSIIIGYYADMDDPSTDTVATVFIGYLSIAYFSGIPLMIMFIYPVYWKQLKSIVALHCVSGYRKA